VAGEEYLDFFFEAATGHGEITNMEPHKCDDFRWFPLDALPDNTIPYIRHALRCYREGVGYSEWGWGDFKDNRIGIIDWVARAVFLVDNFSYG
jgi:hypothetical protein